MDTADIAVLKQAHAWAESGHDAALGDHGRVILSDFSSEMIRVARRAGDEIGVGIVDYRVLDAEELDLSDASVDGAISRWGYMLMPRPARALAETRRVLRPGGRLSFAVFAEPARNPWASLASGVLVAQGRMAPPAPGTPGIFALHDPHALTRLVREAGFTQVDIVEVPHRWQVADAAAYWRFITEVAGAISMVIAQLEASAREAVRAEIDTALEKYRTGEGYAMEAVSLCVLAV